MDNLQKRCCLLNTKAMTDIMNYIDKINLAWETNMKPINMYVYTDLIVFSIHRAHNKAKNVSQFLSKWMYNVGYTLISKRFKKYI